MKRTHGANPPDSETAVSGRGAEARRPAPRKAGGKPAPGPVGSKAAAGKGVPRRRREGAAAAPTGKKPASGKPSAPKPRGRSKAPAAEGRAARRTGQRLDFGKPVEGFFEKQPPQLRAILDELRKLIVEAAPDAEASIKWGMPFYSVQGAMMCALTAHKAHVNLVLSGPPSGFADPDKLLLGAGKEGRHLRVTSAENLPRVAVREWLRTAAAHARRGPVSRAP